MTPSVQLLSHHPRLQCTILTGSKLNITCKSVFSQLVLKVQLFSMQVKSVDLPTSTLLRNKNTRATKHTETIMLAYITTKSVNDNSDDFTYCFVGSFTILFWIITTIPVTTQWYLFGRTAHTPYFCCVHFIIPLFVLGKQSKDNIFTTYWSSHSSN